MAGVQTVYVFWGMAALQILGLLMRLDYPIE